MDLSLGILHALGATLVAVLGALLIVSKLKPRGQLLPPGPSGLPWLGVGLQLPTDGSWNLHTLWAKQFGMLQLIMSLIYIYHSVLMYARSHSPLLFLWSIHHHPEHGGSSSRGIGAPRSIVR
jgi:hypothetical protein